MKKILPALLALFFLPVLTACFGEDRSDEEPFAPTVATTAANAAGDSCVVEGEIISSPNSSIRGRGFCYGNDTLKIQVVSYDTLTWHFTETLDSLKSGIYYVYAFATNGMGTSYGDTLTFRID